MTTQGWVGKTIGGRYKIEALLGQGGMSAVYRAFDPNLRRAVAIKLIHPHLSTDPNFVGRFKEEAAAVARLRHPNIVQVHDFNLDGNTYYMVMEYLVGETLQTRLRRLNTTGRFMPQREAVQICAQISDAVGYAHEHEIIHRDIKPANIMLDVQGQAILMDFGIVKIIGGEYHTSTGATIGTAMYMSPEQIRGERAIDRSDIYSLGVTLYEMLSGRPPFQADSAVTLMMMVLNDPLPDLKAIRAEIPIDLIDIVYHAMERDKNNRYGSMAALTDDLRKVMGKLVIEVPEKTVVEERKDQPVPAGESIPQADPTVVDISESIKEAPERKGATDESFPAREGQKLPTDDGLVSKQDASSSPASIMRQATIKHLKINPKRVIRRYALPIIGLLLVAVLAYFGIQYLVSNRQPATQLSSLTNTQIPLNAASAINIVSLGAWKTDSYVVDLAFSPDGSTLLTANDRDWLRSTRYRYYAGLWQVDPPELKSYLIEQEQWVSDVAFSTDGKLVGTASDDASICIWDAETADLVRKIDTSMGGITGIDFSPNDQLLAGSTWDGYVGLWQVSNGNLLRSMPKQDYGIKTVVFSPDGTWLAAGSETGPILIWKIGEIDPTMTLEGHAAAVNRLAFSPDGSILASASEDHSIRLWNINDGSYITLLGHSETVKDVAFSLDGTLLSSGSDDGTLRFWQVVDGQLLYMLSLEESILSVELSPNGFYLASGAANGMVQFWGVSELLQLEPTTPLTTP